MAADPDQEPDYRALCAQLEAQLAQAELDILEFTQSSKDLQHELELELDRMDKADKRIRADLDHATRTADDWKDKYTAALRQHSATISHMQHQLESLRQSDSFLRAKLRDIELDNDDLEKSDREKDSSLHDLETRYNKALERIALLEQDLVNKAHLEEHVQRLKDDLRDVNEELSITRMQLAALSPAPNSPAAPLASSSLATLDDAATPALDPAPIPAPTLLSTRIRTSTLSSPSPSPSPSPSRIARSTSFSALPLPPSPAPFPAPLVAGAPPLARSTRTAQLARAGSGTRAGLPASPSTPMLASPSATATARRPQARERGALPRTDTATMIRDMQQMTTRVRALTHRLDQRRDGAGAALGTATRASAIPRAPSAGSPVPLTGAGTGAGAGGRGLGRSATMRGLSNAAGAPPPPPLPPPARPQSRLGLGRAAPAGEAPRGSSSTRPPSRAAACSALGSSSSSSSRPASRAASPLPHPLHPSVPRSHAPTPTNLHPGTGAGAGAGARASTRPRPASALARSIGAAGAGAGVGAATGSGSGSGLAAAAAAGLASGAERTRRMSVTGTGGGGGGSNAAATRAGLARSVGSQAQARRVSAGGLPSLRRRSLVLAASDPVPVPPLPLDLPGRHPGTVNAVGETGM